MMRTLVFIAVLAIAMGPFPAFAIPWSKAIKAVEANADEMGRRADALGYPISAGTLVNELDVAEHRCSILGRMLGKTSLIAHLEYDYPEHSKDGHEFRLAEHSMRNWINQAKQIILYGREKKVKQWNLDCAGKMGIPRSAFISESSINTFYEVEGDTLRILGDVEDGFYERVRTALSSNGNIKKVALGSGGGNVIEAMNAGALIRSMQLETFLWNNCYSACTFVFMGGNRRIIYQPHADLGFHQVSSDGRAVPLDHDIYLLIAGFVREMGISWKAVIDGMHAASPSDFYYFEADDLCQHRIATWVQRLCTAS